jgi:hypothetical protein
MESIKQATQISTCPCVVVVGVVVVFLFFWGGNFQLELSPQTRSLVLDIILRDFMNMIEVGADRTFKRLISKII